MLHIALHLLVPGAIALIFFRSRWQRAWLLMLATMLVDIDHLLATPIYDPSRCSIGFHPLHEWWFIAIYAVMTLVPQTRIIGTGLLIHMALDAVDCQVNTGAWHSD